MFGVHIEEVNPRGIHNPWRILDTWIAGLLHYLPYTQAVNRRCEYNYRYVNINRCLVVTIWLIYMSLVFSDVFWICTLSRRYIGRYLLYTVHCTSLLVYRLSTSKFSEKCHNRHIRDDPNTGIERAVSS